MSSRNRAFLLPLVALLAAAPAVCQGDDINPDESAGWQGFTGLFNVISPDTLDKGHVSFGVTHRNYDRQLSDLDVNDLSGNLAVGVSKNLEFGLAYAATRQVDYDNALGRYNNMPFPIGTIEEGGGDLLLGVKIALKRIEDSGAGASLFGNIKLPTADEKEGFGTGGADYTLGGAIGWDRRPVAVYGNASYTFVGDAELASRAADLDLSDMVRYGAGLEVGSHHWVRGIAEVMGESFVSQPSGAPDQETSVDVTLGFKVGGAQHRGVSFGAAWQRNVTMDSEILGNNTNPTGWVAELSYTSFTPPLPPAPIEPEPAVNHNPTAKVSVNPAAVYPAHSPKTHTATATCTASDPDDDPLTYAWTSSAGQLSGSGVSVTWTPSEGVEDGTFTITCRVTDGKGGSGQDTGSVKVMADAERPWKLRDRRVFFEFDRYDLSSEATALLDEYAAHLKAYPSLKVTIEGHACYIATEEYNLALGQHRAEAIKTYLVNNGGIDMKRIPTVSYGESRPWQDNSREITRRLNRRGEFVLAFEPQM